MADVLIDANAKATAARAAGQPALTGADLAHIRSWYRGAVAKGITDNAGETTPIAEDSLALARRFRDHENMILRFVTDLAVGFTSNQAYAPSAPSRFSSGPPAGPGAPSPPGRLRRRPLLPVHRRQMGIDDSTPSPSSSPPAPGSPQPLHPRN